MDILKYLDILIGLALVMVLLSPMVTAMTQIWMWLRNRRTLYLQQMLVRLLKQIDGPHVVRLEVRAGGTGSAGAVLTTEKGPLGTTDPKGYITLPRGLPADEITAGPLRITATSALGTVGGVELTARYVPQHSLDDTRISDLSSATGSLHLQHKYEDAPGLASRKATLIVSRPGASPVSALSWSLNGSPQQTLQLTAVKGTQSVSGEIDLPVVKEVPFEYTFDIALNANGIPATNDTIEIVFSRFEGADRTVKGEPAPDGTILLSALRGLDTSFAETLARAIVRHQVLSRGDAALPSPFLRVPPFKNRDAEVIEREELIRVLLELGAAEGQSAGVLNASDRDRLLTVLALNGISDPAATLSNVRAAAQQLEAKNPETAAHVRHMKAIVSGAQSDLVGRINHWFDAASARATQQYAAEARALTVAAAFVVATVAQLDTFGLLRRLSSDPQLRAALMIEAQAEQERIDKHAASGSSGGTTTATTTNAAAPGTVGGSAHPDALALATARRDEVQRNLTKLRSPSFSILPDHFIWQRLPKARVERNPFWTSPYPSNLFLMTGGSTYTIPMRWRRDPLADMKASIEASNVPVKAVIEPDGNDILIRAAHPLDLQILSAVATDAPRINVASAEITLRNVQSQQTTETGTMTLALDKTEIMLPDVRGTDILATLASAVAKTDAPLTVTCHTPGGTVIIPCSRPFDSSTSSTQRRIVSITSTDPRIREISLRNADPLTLRTARAVRHQLATTLIPVARAALTANPGSWLNRFEFTAARPMRLFVDNKIHSLTFSADKFTVFGELARVVRDVDASLAVSCFKGDHTVLECTEKLTETADSVSDPFLELTATDPNIREIRLLWNPQDPFSNVLSDTTQAGKAWRLRHEWLEQAKTAEIFVTAGFPQGRRTTFRIDPPGDEQVGAYYARQLTDKFTGADMVTYGLTVSEYPGDDLTLTATRLGPLELRHSAAKPESNILDTREEYVYPIFELFDRSLNTSDTANDPSLPGVLLSWVLLSLGAPFWYDALKNLLRLRPSAAAVEEKNRTDRSTETRATE